MDMTENQTLTERLDNQLSKISEAGKEVTSKDIERLVYKYSQPPTDKLIWALIKKSVEKDSDKFIPPSFNEIKPLLIKDIKHWVKVIMSPDYSDLPPEERDGVIRDLLDPNDRLEYENYANTTFGEDKFWDKIWTDSNLEKVRKYEEDVINFLDREIAKNYRSLIPQI